MNKLQKIQYFSKLLKQAISPASSLAEEAFVRKVTGLRTIPKSTTEIVTESKLVIDNSADPISKYRHQDVCV